jgi:hypothetical protein
MANGLVINLLSNFLRLMSSEASRDVPRRKFQLLPLVPLLLVCLRDSSVD